MKPPKHPLSITYAEFDRGLREAFLLDDQTLYARSGAKPSRSYFVRHQGRILPLKAVLRLAYILAGKPWGYMQSASAARQLKSGFDILYLSDGIARGAKTREGVPIVKPVDIAITRMFRTMLDTVTQANGQMVERRVKEKTTSLNQQEWEELLRVKLGEQEDRCALTGLPLGYDGECDDKEMLASLDRIDSNGHYTPDNVQIVCRFMNRWKGADDDGLVRRLLGELRSMEGGT